MYVHCSLAHCSYVIRLALVAGAKPPEIIGKGLFFTKNGRLNDKAFRSCCH